MKIQRWLLALVVVLVSSVNGEAKEGANQALRANSVQDKQTIELRKQLDESRKKFGKSDPRTAGALEQLAGHLSQQKQYEDAIPLYAEATAIRQMKFDPDRYREVYPPNGVIVIDPNNPSYMYGQDLDNWHWNCFWADEFKMAIEPCKKLAELDEKYLGPVHDQTGQNFLQLAVCQNKAGEYKEAEKSAQRAIAISEKLHGAQYTNLIPWLVVLANVYVNMENDSKAEQVYKRELSILDATDPKSPWRAGILEDYAELMRRTNRAKEATSMEADAQKVRERTHTVREHKVGGQLLRSK